MPITPTTPKQSLKKMKIMDIETLKIFQTLEETNSRMAEAKWAMLDKKPKEVKDMDKESGKIKELTTQEELNRAIAEEKWELLGKKPDKNCRICYGRGHIGRDTRTGLFVPCRCTEKPKKETKT